MGLSEPPPWSPARRAITLAVLLVAAFALRWWVARSLPLVEVDGAYWCSLAGAFERGDLEHAWSAAWPPLFPLAIAGTARLLEALGAARGPATLEWAARMVSMIAGTLLVLPLLALARRLLHGPAARLVPALAVVHPRLVEYSAAALSESLFTLALVGGLAALPPAAGPRRREGLAGALFGAAFLIRPEALPLGLGLWAVAVAHPGAHGVRRLRPAFLAGLLIVSLPWLVHLRQETGEWTLGEKGAYNFWRAHRASYERVLPAPAALAPRVNRSPELAPPARPHDVDVLAFARARPDEVLASTGQNLGRLLVSSLPVAAAWPVALLALAALFLPRAGPWWQVLAPLAIVPLLIAPFSADRRFMVPLVPLTLPLAARAIAEVGERWGPSAWSWVRALLGTGLAIYALGVPGRADRAPEQRAAGEWLAAISRPPVATAGAGTAVPERASGPPATRRPVVMARKPWVAFYSGGLIADLPDAPPDSILADARHTGATVLVADARSARTDRPQLAAWLDAASPPPGWRLLRRWTGGDPIALFTPDSAALATPPPSP
jgi:hypothetical protein